MLFNMNYSSGNKLKKLLFGLSGVVLLWGCKKNFLEVQPQGQLTEAAVAADPNLARKLVTGVYNQLYQGGFIKSYCPQTNRRRQ